MHGADARDLLFTPLALGAIALGHRVVMAPPTQMRSRPSRHVPQPLDTAFYQRRASRGGLLITEATDISEQARGYPMAPGIYTDVQVAQWRGVTEAVHAAGGLIVLRIRHAGRMSHPSMQPGGGTTVAPSALLPASLRTVDAACRETDLPVPHRLSVTEIGPVVAMFATAAWNARIAGFDGVELHGADGYLIDQFLQDSSNLRSDRYGGSVVNRGRFLLEVVDAVMAAWSADRIGVILSPWGSFNGMGDSDPASLYAHVGRELAARGLAYLHVLEPCADRQSGLNAHEAPAPRAGALLKRAFGGPVISAGRYVGASARAELIAQHADAIAFGRLFAANPDLPRRLAEYAPMTEYSHAAFYGGDAPAVSLYPAFTATA